MNYTVLYIVYFFPPLDTVGTSIRAVKFLKYLQDWDFIVICGDKEHPMCPSVHNSSQHLMSEIPQHVNVVPVAAPICVPVWKPGNYSNLLLSPLAEWLWLRSIYKKVLDIIKKRKIDLIFLSAPPFLLLSLTHKLKKTVSMPVVLEFRDDWIDTPIFSQKPRWLQNLQRRVEKKAVVAANKIVTVTETSINCFQQRYPQIKEKLIYIPNGWDKQDISPLQSISNNKFIISSAGGYRRHDRSPESFFKAISRLIARRPQIKEHLQISLFGNWLYKDFSIEELKRLQVDDLINESKNLNRCELIQSLQNSQILLVISSSFWNRSIPGKLYEYWGLGRAPILTIDDAGGAVGEFTKKYNLGTAVIRQDIKAIELAIEKYYDAWLAGTPIKISVTYVEQFERCVLAKQIEKVFINVINKS